MFGFKPKQPAESRGSLRDALFGDHLFATLSNLSPQALASEPWASFDRAKRFIEQKDSANAAQTLRQVLSMPQVESRILVQAWHLLRDLGTEPSQAEAKQVLGVVVEVGMPKGVDLLAGYDDHCARYWNFSGKGVAWEHPNDSLDGRIDDLLKKGSVVVHRIGPWKETRPAAPSNGLVRLNFLTPSGLHFGEGPMNLIAKDALGGPVLNSAITLMKALMELGRQNPSARWN